jgi:hypothetical protein
MGLDPIRSRAHGWQSYQQFVRLGYGSCCTFLATANGYRGYSPAIGLDYFAAPLGLYVWDGSLGGDTSDDDVRKNYAKKQANQIIGPSE